MADKLFAAIYASEDAYRQEAPSLDEQVARCIEIAGERGYLVDPGFIRQEYWTDIHSDRPGLDEVRRIVAGGLVDAVIVYSPQNLSPDEFGLIELIAEFQEADVEVHFVCGSLDELPELLLRFI